MVQGRRKYVLPLLVAIFCSCGAPPSKQPVATGARTILEPPRAVSPSSPPCLTIRDAELSCVRSCEPLGPVIGDCARHLTADDNPPPLGYRVVVRAISAGGGGVDDVRVELPPSSNASVRAVADCIKRAVGRFVPCLRVQEGQEIVFPVRVTAASGPSTGSH